MINMMIFLTTIGIAAALGGALVVMLFRPLYIVLVDLCGTDDRAALWVNFLGLVMVLAPVLCAGTYMVIWPYPEDQMLFVQRAFIVAMFGIAVVLMAIMRTLLRWIRDLEFGPRNQAPEKARPEQVLTDARVETSRPVAADVAKA